MPPPFPGMDPFLEDAFIFPDLHDSLIIHMKDALQAKLPSNYYAITGNRIWVDMARTSYGPDVRIHKKKGPDQAGPSTSVLTARPVRVTVPKDEIRETFIDIFAKQDSGKRLVTSIEILSPTNKALRQRGRKLYREKQREMLRGRVNLVEIDLLRRGRHTTAVPLAYALEKTGPFDYHICVHRFDRAEDYFIYPIQLPEHLPVVAIPLDPGISDVEVSLQELFDHIYDVGPYKSVLAYTGKVPPPSLSPEKEAWVRETLAEKGIAGSVA